MKFSAVFDVFSKRDEEEAFTYEVPETFRTKVILFCGDVFSNKQFPFGGANYTGEFWEEIHKMLQYRHGTFQLAHGGHPGSRFEDARGFLLTCEDEHFLDFLEYIFKTSCLFRVQKEENEIVREINELFASENMGYELTDMVKETVVEPAEVYPLFGREVEQVRTVAYPQVVRKDSRVIHARATKPALTLLANPKFKAANEEYLGALEDYRNGDYGDCLVKCGSAFESVMKVICDDKGWPYQQRDTAGTLVRMIIDNTSLDSYFDQPLLIIATLRNRLSGAHGAGTQPRTVPQHLAQYALNATASAIIMLVEETK